MHERHSKRHHGERFARGDSKRGEHGYLDGGHGPRGRRHGPEHGPGPGDRRRVFDHGELRLVVLALIAEQPRHGYEIIKAVEDRLAGSYSPSPGVIYPTLTMLEELGHATVAEDGGKKRYAITDEGRAYLAVHAGATDAAFARMTAIKAAHGGGPAPQIVRAMENVKLALRLRQGRGPLSEAELNSVAAALDTAATAIERS